MDKPYNNDAEKEKEPAPNLLDLKLPTSGFTWNLTPDQAKTLQALKNFLGEMIPKRYDDSLLCRFLRARNWSLKSAAAMILNDMEWRLEVGADTIHDTFKGTKYFQTLVDYWPGRVHGVDRNGAPVWIERVGLVDVKGLFTQISENDLLKFHIYMMEMAERERAEAGKKRGRPIEEGSIVIQDCKGLSWKSLYNPALPTLKKLTLMDAQHYPECLQRLFIINAPTIFQLVWNIIKKWIDKSTLAKIHVLGSDYEKVLDKYISKDQLPRFLRGGHCKCDKLKFSDSCMPLAGKFAGMPDDVFEEQKIESRETFEITVNVDEVSSILCWEFRTKDMDIAFGLFYLPPERSKGVHTSIKVAKPAEREEVLPITRFQCDETAVRDQFVVKKAGRYILIFDNKHSMLRSKLLRYQVTVERSPEVLEKEREREFLERAERNRQLLDEGVAPVTALLKEVPLKKNGEEGDDDDEDNSDDDDDLALYKQANEYKPQGVVSPNYQTPITLLGLEESPILTTATKISPASSNLSTAESTTSSAVITSSSSVTIISTTKSAKKHHKKEKKEKKERKPKRSPIPPIASAPVILSTASASHHHHNHNHQHQQNHQKDDLVDGSGDEEEAEREEEEEENILVLSTSGGGLTPSTKHVQPPMSHGF